MWLFFYHGRTAVWFLALPLFSHLRQNCDFADGLSVLNPDLVIISLGANEAFGKTGPEDIYRAMDMVVSDIKEANPFSEILLVTPMDMAAVLCLVLHRAIVRLEDSLCGSDVYGL